LRKTLSSLFVILFVATALWAAGKAYLIRVDGAIGPVSAEFIVGAIERAEDENAECLIVELDTPGGLDASMRQIVKKVMASEVPIVVYISPSGSRAASAGAVIALAAHIAAMAPGTNIGAAHPVQIGGAQIDSTMAEKITNDAVAYVKSIAERRGRNVSWAEDAVRKSISSTEREALELGVVDLVCPTVRALLDSLDGRSVELPSGRRTLNTKGARVEEIKMGFRQRFLSAISNPNIAYILMILGFYGLLFELSNPGSILPGVVGGICLILAFYSFQTLPVNYAGLALIAFGIILFLAESMTPTHGILTAGGVVSLLLGSAMLFETTESFLKVSWGVIVPVVIATVLFFTFAIGKGLLIQRRRPATGVPYLVGQIGEARTDIARGREGIVFLSGEHWKAVSDERIRRGDKVEVVEVNRSVLKVIKRR